MIDFLFDLSLGIISIQFILFDLPFYISFDIFVSPLFHFNKGGEKFGILNDNDHNKHGKMGETRYLICLTHPYI